MRGLSEAGERAVARAAARHGFGAAAVHEVLRALRDGGGAAQFRHPELGGMGQWAAPGAVMVGDMFNRDLAARVDGLCTDLAETLRGDALLEGGGPAAPEPGARQLDGPEPGRLAPGGHEPGGAWWPSALGRPGASGTQGGMRYVVFPEACRLAVQRDGTVTLYDTGGHRIGGVAQGRTGTAGSLAFTDRDGEVRLESLRVVGRDDLALPHDASGGAGVAHASGTAPGEVAPGPGGTDRTSPATVAEPVAPVAAEPLDVLERLGALRREGALTEAEFTAAKARVLGRL